MLKVTADIFSGRENPQWIVEGKEAQAVLKDLSQARNTDQSGHIITDPRTANRGPHTIFCGFYYAQKKMVIK